MKPTVWGPSAWIFLHSITLTYPEKPSDNDKQHIKHFFGTLEYVLPCAKCKNHYYENLKKYPITDTVLESKNNLVKWLIDLHNEVNIINGKKALTYNEAMYQFAQRKMIPMSHEYKNTKMIFVKCLIMILVFSLLIVMLMKSNTICRLFEKF